MTSFGLLLFLAGSYDDDVKSCPIHVRYQQNGVVSCQIGNLLPLYVFLVGLFLNIDMSCGLQRATILIDLKVTSSYMVTCWCTVLHALYYTKGLDQMNEYGCYGWSRVHDNSVRLPIYLLQLLTCQKSQTGWSTPSPIPFSFPPIFISFPVFLHGCSFFNFPTTKFFVKLMA